MKIDTPKTTKKVNLNNKEYDQTISNHDICCNITALTTENREYGGYGNKCDCFEIVPCGTLCTCCVVIYQIP